MKAEEIAQIASKHNAAIIAPAGHGKTEMITELVDKLPGKKLVLTHTNAGVSALTQRLERKHIPRDKYSLSTISSFCLKWCNAYPATAQVDLSIPLGDSRFYDDRYRGAATLFSHLWTRKILSNTYTCVVVDEYQDCIISQHKIFLAMNATIPVYVLGDPLQSIFGWAGKPVSWNTIEFETVSVDTYPYRWENTNPCLGSYLTAIREDLLPALDGKRVRIPTIPVDSYVKRVSPKDLYGSSLLKELNQFQSVLFLTKWPAEQCAFSKQTAGFFQNDEPQNLNDLYNYAQRLDSDNGAERATALLEFIDACATHVSSELASYKQHIESEDYDFSRITKHPRFGELILSVYNEQKLCNLLSVLHWIQSVPVFRLYRKELYKEMIRSIRLADEKGLNIHAAAQQVRMSPSYQSRYAGYKRLSSRAVLSKGLEFECVVVDLSKRFTATEMYVALTRATKAIYFLTDSDSVILDVPQGL